MLEEQQNKITQEIMRKRNGNIVLKVGNWAMLDSSGITWPSDKKRPKLLKDCWLGPFPVIEANDKTNQA